MANIMVTELCNLSCSYCFASEFVNKKINEICIEDFQKAVDFIVSSKSFNGMLGLIGGEPTLHSRFPDLLAIINNINQIRDATIFTNGIKIDETINITSGEKFSFLINLNSPEVVGGKIYSRITNNIDDLVRKYQKKRAVTLGLNLYQVDMDYSFYVDLLRQYRFRNARLSITVPNASYGPESFERLALFKRQTYQLYVDLRYQGINVIFDCNKVPVCLWSEEEIMKISLIQANNENARLGFNLNANKCNPVIDILPDLTAIRCFGLSQIEKVRIEDFESLEAIQNYFYTRIDEKMARVPTIPACLECDMFRNLSCYGGCLANKPGIN